MKDYYAILGVGRSASEAEIKRSFRRLAVTYHPDKNPDPAAEVVFKELSEAYEILGDPDKKRGYDYLISLQESPRAEDISQPAPARHRDPAYRRRTAPPPKTKSERQQMLEMMQRNMPKARIMLKVAFGFCLFLIIDFLLPFRNIEGIVSKISSHHGRHAQPMSTISLSTGDRFQIEQEGYIPFHKGDTVIIHATRLLSVIVEAQTEKNVTVSVPVTIYGVFLFAPIVLLLMCLLGLFYPAIKPELQFNLGVASFFVLLLNIVFLMMS